MTDVLALDIATSCGFARGGIYGQPVAGSLRFGLRPDGSVNAVFGDALRWIRSVLEPEPRPDLLIVEALLAPNSKLGMTTKATTQRLMGLHGVIRAVANEFKIPEIAEASVLDVRAHFIGDRNARRSRAKNETIARCRLLGWQARNEDEADALALWSYASSLIDPKLALRVVPMFNRRLVG